MIKKERKPKKFGAYDSCGLRHQGSLDSLSSEQKKRVHQTACMTRCGRVACAACDKKYCGDYVNRHEHKSDLIRNNFQHFTLNWPKVQVFYNTTDDSNVESCDSFFSATIRLKNFLKQHIETYHAFFLKTEFSPCSDDHRIVKPHCHLYLMIPKGKKQVNIKDVSAFWLEDGGLKVDTTVAPKRKLEDVFRYMKKRSIAFKKRSNPSSPYFTAHERKLLNDHLLSIVECRRGKKSLVIAFNGVVWGKKWEMMKNCYYDLHHGTTQEREVAKTEMKQFEFILFPPDRRRLPKKHRVFQRRV